MQLAQLQLIDQHVDAATSPASTPEQNEIAGPIAAHLPDGRAAISPPPAASDVLPPAATGDGVPTEPARTRSTRRGQVVVPEIVGLSAIAAIAAVRTSGLTPVIEQHDTDAPEKVGIVLLQQPNADVEVTRGSSVELWVGTSQKQSASDSSSNESTATAEPDQPSPPTVFDPDCAYVEELDDGWFTPQTNGSLDTLTDDAPADDVLTDAATAAPELQTASASLSRSNRASHDGDAGWRAQVPRGRTALLLAGGILLLLAAVASVVSPSAPRAGAVPGRLARAAEQHDHRARSAALVHERRAFAPVVLRHRQRAARYAPTPSATARVRESSTPTARQQPTPSSSNESEFSWPSAAPPAGRSGHPISREFFVP